MFLRRLLLITACCLLPAACFSADSTLDRIRPAVEASITHGDLPGAVIAVLHDGRTVYREAFGRRAIKPQPEPMTVDTIFDLASLTKPIATATSIMILVEQGKLKLDEPVATYWPAFAANGKDKITVEHLLLHTSGLIADNPISDYEDGPEKALERICQLKLGSAGRREVHLQRRQLHRARRDRRPGERDAAGRVRPDVCLRAARNERDRAFGQPSRCGRAAPRRSSATATGCAARSTTRGPTPSAASPGMPACSAPPTMCSYMPA